MSRVMIRPPPGDCLPIQARAFFARDTPAPPLNGPRPCSQWPTSTLLCAVYDGERTERSVRALGGGGVFFPLSPISVTTLGCSSKSFEFSPLESGCPPENTPLLRREYIRPPQPPRPPADNDVLAPVQNLISSRKLPAARQRGVTLRAGCRVPAGAVL